MVNLRTATLMAVLGLAGCNDDARPRTDFATLEVQIPWTSANGRETRKFTLPDSVDMLG